MKGKGFWIIFVSILTIAVGVFAFIAIKSSTNKVQVFADTEAKYQTRFLKPEATDTPENSTAEDAVAFALYTLTHTERFEILTDGESKASVATQTVYGKKTIIGDEAICHSISSGLVKMGIQKYFVKNSGKVFYRDYDTIKGKDVTWSNNPPKCVSEKTFRKSYGQDPFTGNNYIICPETIISGEMVNKGDGLWGIQLNMRTESDYTPFWYQREVASNGSSSMVPEFQLIELEFVVDSSWTIRYLNIHEKYVVKSMGVKALCDTNVTDSYYYENIEFDKDDYAYFKQYKNMVPSDYEEEKKDDDVLTMLTSSLIKDDGTNTNIKVDLNIGGEELKGIVELNLSDLKNIKAKGQLNEIYFEYIDDTIYISLGDNLKIKSSTENLTKLIALFDTGDGGLSLDVDSIIKAINSGEVVKDESIYKVKTSLTVGNIKINIQFETEFYEESHTYKLISLNADLVVNDLPVSVEAFNTTETVKTRDLSTYQDLSNLDYVFEYLSKLILYKAASIDLNVDYKGILANVEVQGSLADSLVLNAKAKVEYQGKEVEVSVKFKNDIIYIDFYNIHLKSTIINILDMIKKYSGIDLSPMLVSGPTIDTSNIDIKTIIVAVLSLDFDQFIKDFTLNEEELNATVDLSSVLETLKEINLVLKNKDGISVEINYDEIKANALIKPLESYELSVDSASYSNIREIQYLVDDIISLVDKKALSLKASAEYNGLLINANLLADFNDSIKIDSEITLTYENKQVKLYVKYINDNIYLSVGNINLMVSKDYLFTLLSKFGVEANLDLDTNISVEKILGIILSLDYNKLIKTLEFESEKISINLDLSDYIEILSDLEIIINNTKQPGFSVETNFYHVCAELNALDSVRIGVDKDYQDLANADFLIDEVLELIEKRAMAIDLSLNVKELTIKVNGELSFNDEIIANVQAIVESNGLSKTIEVKYVNNTIYLDIEGIKLSISVSDLMTLLSKAGVDTELNTPDMSIETILGLIFSIDLDKLIKEFTIGDKEIKLSLNVSDFISELNELNIMIKDETEGLSLSLSLFDVLLKVKPLDEVNVEVSDDYNNISFASFILDDALLIIKNKKAEAIATIKVFNLDVNAHLYVDINESLKLKALISLSNGTNSKDLEVTFLNNTIYLTIDSINVKITVEELISLLNEFGIDTESVTSKLNSSTLSLEDIIAVIFSLDFKKIVKSFTINENNINLSLDLSDFIKSLNDLVILVENTDEGFDLSVNLYEINAQVLCDRDFNVEVEDNKYQNLTFVKFLIDDVMLILDSKEVEANVSLVYESLNISANALIDFSDAIKVKANVVLSNGTNSKEIEVLFIDNTIYLSVDSINVKITLETLFGLLAQAGVDTSSITNLETNEMSVEEIINTILSIDLANIIKVFKLEESKITLSADLSSFVDFLNEINVILTDEGSNTIGLSLDMFNINGTIKSVSNSEILVEKDYKELANLSFIIDDVFEIIDTKAIELNISFKYEDFIINGNIVVDFNDAIKVKGHIVLTYKEYTKELDLVFVNNTIYVSIDSINLSITLEDLVEILSYANVDVTPVLGVMSGEAQMNVNEIIDMVLSINFSDIVKALEIEDKYLSINLDLSMFIESISDLALIIEEGTEGLDLTVNMFDITGNIKSISNPEINTFDAVNLGEAKVIVRNIVEIINNKKISINGSLKYESLDIAIDGELDFTESIKVKANVTVSNGEYQKTITLVFKDNTIYVSLDNLNLMITVDELMDLLGVFDVELGSNEFNLDSVLGIVLSKNLSEIITTLSFVDSKLNVSVDLSSLIEMLGVINATIGADRGLNVSLDMFDAEISVLSIDETNIEPAGEFERVYNAKFVLEFVKAILENKALNIALSLNYESLNVTGNVLLDFNDAIKVKANVFLSNGTDSKEVELLFIDNVIYLSVDSIDVKISLETLFTILSKAGVDTTQVEGFINGSNEQIDINEIIGLVLSINLNDIIKVLRLEESKITISADLSRFLEALNDIEVIISDLEGKVGLSINMFDINVEAEVIENSNIQIEKSYKELANLSFIIDNVFEIIDTKAVELNISLKYKDFIINGDIIVDFNDAIKVKGHVVLNYKEYTKELDLVFINNTIYVSIDSINLSITLEDLVEILSYAEIDITPVLGVISGESSMNINEIIDMVLSINFSDVVKALEIEDKYLSVGLDLSKFIDSISELSIIIEEAREGLMLSVDMFDITATIKSISNPEINSFEAVNLGEAKDVVRNVIEIVNSKKLALDASLKYESLDITLNGELDFTDSIKAKVNAIISNSEYQKSLNLVFVDNTIYVSLDNLNLMITVDELMEILGLFDITLDSNELNLESVLGIILSKNLSEIITTLEFIDSKLNLSINLKDFIDILDEINMVIDANNGINVSLDMFDAEINVLSLSETNIEPTGEFEKVYNAKFVVEFVKAVLDNKTLSVDLSLKYETLTVTGNVVLDFNDSINAKINATLSNGTDSKDIEILFIDNVIYLSVDSINVKITLETLFTIINKAGVDTSKVEGFLNGSESSIDINEVIGLVLSLNLNDIIKVLKLEESRITLSADLSLFLEALDDISLIISDLDGKVGLTLNMFDVEATVEVIDNANIQVEKDYKELANLTFIADNVFEIIDTKAIEANIELKYEKLFVNASVVADFNEELKVKVNAYLTYKDMYKDIVVVFVNKTIYVSIDSINLSITLEDLFEILSYANVDMSKVEDLMSGNKELNVLDIIDTVLSINFSDVVKALEIEDKYLSVNLDLSRFIESMNDLSLIITEGTNGLNLSVNMFDITGNIKSISNPEINTFDATDLGESKEIVRNVIELIKNKKVSITGTLKYESLNIALDGKVDFTESIIAKVNVLLSNAEHSKEISVIYADDTLYLSIDTINLKITFEELVDILKVFDIDLESDEDTLEKVLDKVFELDFNEIIKTLEFIDSKLNLGVDLTSLIDILGEINAIISVENGINVSLDMLDAELNVSKADSVEYALESSYERVYNAKFIVELVKDILDKKAISIDLSFAKDDLTASGIAILDFADTLKVKADLTISYKQLELPVSIFFLTEEGDAENVIYIDLYNVHATITVAELLEALNLENKELKLDDIIDLVLSLNFDELINSVSIEEGLISLLLDLRSLDIELLDKIIDTNVLQDLTIKNENSNLRVYSNSLFNLTIEVSTISQSNIEKSNNEYVNLKGILTEVMDKIDELKDSSFEADITGNINLGDVLIVNLDATLDAKVKVVKDGDNYQISIIGHIETADFIMDLNVVIDDGYLYLTLGGFNAKLKLDGIMDFIEDVIAIFKEECSESSSLDLSSLNALLETLRLESDHEVNADLSSLISKFTTMYVLVNLDGESIIKVNDDKNNEFASLKVTLNVNNNLEKVELPQEVVTEDDILSLIEDINDIIQLVKSKNFLIKIASSTSPIEFYKDSELKFKIYGTLNVVPYGDDHYNYKIEVNLIEYKNNKKINSHYIGLVYYSEMFYLTYRNSANEANAINATSTKEDVYGLIAAIEEALDLDLSMLDDILVDFTPYLDENLKHVDFTQLRGLIKNLTKSDDSSSTKEKINISKVLYEFKILSGWCSTRLDNHEISKELPAKNYSTISFRRDDSREFNDAYIDSFYLKYEDGIYTGVKNISLEFERGIEIRKPNFSNPYDFSHMGELIKGLLVAAAYHDFSIKGTITLQATVFVSMDVPIQAYVHNDEEGKPVVFVHIDMNDVPLLARLIISKKDIYIVYKDGYIYIDRVESSKHTKIKVTTETFFDDLVYYLLDFAMGLPSSITSEITSSSNEDHTVDASKAVTKFVYSESSGNPKYSIGLDLAEITGSSDLGELKLSINLAKFIAEKVDNKVYEVYTVKSITDLSLSIASILDISCSKLELSNVSYQNGFEEVVINNKELREYILSYVSQYFTINGAEYDPDKIYENNSYKSTVSHHVYFIQGSGTTLSGDQLEIITVDCASGSTFSLKNPTSEYVMISGREYYFGGWYTSRDYKTQYTADMCVMGDRNINIYALWIPMYEYRVEDVNGNGYSTFYKYGESTATYTVNTSNGEFLGFYDRVTGELVDSSTTLSSRVVEGDIYVYARWDKMYYLVLDDETKLILSSSSTNTDQVNGLDNDKYQIYKDGIYYTYLKEDITSFMLHTNYESLFIKHVEPDFTYYTFNIYTYNSVREGYREYTFQFNTDLFKDNNGLTPYVSVMILKTNTFNVSLFPYAKYSIYETNAWVNTSNVYYSKDVNAVVEGTRFSAYYSVEQSYFTRSGSKITGFASGKSAETLILPYFINGVVMTTVGQAAFCDNESIKHIYIADSYTTLEQDAFKNTNNLVDAYIAASVTNITKDAFYYDDYDDTMTQKSHGRSVKLYFLYDDLREAYNFNTNKLLAYKYLDWFKKSERYYGADKTEVPETVKTYIITKVMELFN